MKSFIKRYWLIIFSFGVFSCISDLFIMHTHILFSTEDMQFHLKRIMELYSGNYFNPFAFNYFHGSSIMAMYPHFTLIFMDILMHITSSYVESYYYFFILIIFASLIFSFFSSIHFSKSVYVSYLFAVLYSFSISFLINYFHDGDLGITVSLVFLPIVIFGFLDILKGSENFVKLSLGIAFMASCQLPTTVIICVFIFIIFLLNINRINKLVLFNLIKSVILTILFTSIIWIPLLKVLLFNKMYTPGSILIQNSNIVSIIKNVGLIPVIGVIILLFYFNKFKIIMKQIYLVSLILMIISSNFIPLIRFIASFKPMQFINKFQFTARFLIIPQVVLCYLTAWLIIKCMSHIYHFKTSFISIILIILLSQISVQLFIVDKEFSQNYVYTNSYRSVNVADLRNNHIIKDSWVKYLYNGYINNKDYYPINSISKIEYINNNKATYGRGSAINFKHIGYNQFSFDNYKKVSRLTLPIFHYNKENLHIYLDSNLIHYNYNKNDLITLYNLKRGKHKVKIKYLPNRLLVMLEFITSIIGLIWTLLFIFRKRSRNNVKSIY